MPFKLEQSWKIIISLDETSPKYYNSHKLFTLESGKSFLRKIGGGMESFVIMPLVLRPTIVFNNAINKIVKDLGFSGNRFPYKKGDDTLNVAIHFYFEKYIILTVKYIRVDICTPVNLREITLINNYPHVHTLVLAMAELIKTGNYKYITPLTSVGTLRCTSIEISDANVNIFDNSDLVESLTGHLQPVKNIVDDVVNRNEKHQLNKALTLIDKQGVIQQMPFSFAARKEAQKKYISSCNLFELFILINRAVQDDYLGANKVFIKAISSLVKTPQKIVNSFTAIRTIEKFVQDFHLSNVLSELELKENKELHLKELMISKKVKPKNLVDGLKQFYASKEFFAVLFTVIVTGIIAGVGIIIKFLK